MCRVFSKPLGCTVPKHRLTKGLCNRILKVLTGGRWGLDGGGGGAPDESNGACSNGCAYPSGGTLLPTTTGGFSPVPASGFPIALRARRFIAAHIPPRMLRNPSTDPTTAPMTVRGLVRLRADEVNDDPPPEEEPGSNVGIG